MIAQNQMALGPRYPIPVSHALQRPGQKIRCVKQAHKHKTVLNPDQACFEVKIVDGMLHEPPGGPGTSSRDVLVKKDGGGEVLIPVAEFDGERRMIATLISVSQYEVRPKM